MSNTQHLKQVFDQVEQLIASDYRWVSKESQPQDYFDWGLNSETTADSIIQAMIEEGDLEAQE